MSRLAEVFHATGSARSAAGLMSAAPGGAKDDAAEASFQALFAQELAAPVGTAGAIAANACNEGRDSPNDAQRKDGDTGEKSAEVSAIAPPPWAWLATNTGNAPPPEAPPGTPLDHPSVEVSGVTASMTARLSPSVWSDAGAGKAAGTPPISDDTSHFSKVQEISGEPISPPRVAQQELQPVKDSLPRATEKENDGSRLSNVPNLGAQNPAQASSSFGISHRVEAGVASIAVSAPQAGPAPASNAAVAAAPLPPAAPASPSTSVALNTHFSSPAWREDFAQQVVMIGKQDFSSAEIKLNPPQLGPIEVSIHIKNDVAEASFAAASAPVREAIEASIPRLKEMLAEAGITLGNASVSPEFGQARQAFGESQPGERRESGTSPSAPSRGGGEEAAVAVVRRRSFGTVDTFA